MPNLEIFESAKTRRPALRSIDVIPDRESGMQYVEHGVVATLYASRGSSPLLQNEWI